MPATWVTFLFEAANFLLLAAVLGWLFFRPVREALERRRSDLENERSSAHAARAEAERVLEETRARRAEIESSLEAVRERVRLDARAEAERLLEAARAQSLREREGARQELLSLRRSQARALAHDAALAAREIVARLLEKLEGPDLEQTLLRAACRELAALRAAGSLVPLVIDTACSLDDGALAALAEAAGVQARQAEIRVDPALVAGLRVVTPRGLVDASAIGLAARAERVLVDELDREPAP